MSWVGPDPSAFELAASTAYDADGNPTETRDARGGGTIMRWDPADHTTVLSESRRTDGGLLTESATIDRAFGAVLSVTGYNQQTTSVSYDAFGRVAAMARPGDTLESPTVSYAYEASKPLSRVVTTRLVWPGHPDTETTEELVDGIVAANAAAWSCRVGSGCSRMWGCSTHAARRDARFDPGSWAQAVMLPRRCCKTLRAMMPCATRLRGRCGPLLSSASQHAPRSCRSPPSTGMVPRPTRARPTSNTAATDAKDGLGRVVTHSYVLGGATLGATFTYDPAGDLLSKTDPEGNVSRYGYDGRGRRVLVADPDAGRHGYSYDENGNVVSHERPDGTTSRFTYDLADRKLTEDWDGDGAADVTNVWDVSDRTPGSPLFAGLLTRVSDPSGVTEYEYDLRQRQSAAHFTVGGKTYDTASAFDCQDREYWHQYHDRSSIRLYRDERGLVTGYGHVPSRSRTTRTAPRPSGRSTPGSRRRSATTPTGVSSRSVRCRQLVAPSSISSGSTTQPATSCPSRMRDRAPPRGGIGPSSTATTTSIA